MADVISEQPLIHEIKSVKLRYFLQYKPSGRVNVNVKYFLLKNLNPLKRKVVILSGILLAFYSHEISHYEKYLGFALIVLKVQKVKSQWDTFFFAQKM